MANYSIPNSIPEIGRISTLSSQRSRKQNSASACFFRGGSPVHAITDWLIGFFHAQSLTLNAELRIKKVKRRMLAIDYWAFLFWRVKGAWWSSRSSKPLSVPHTRGRGRFDSYPLRTSNFDSQFPTFRLCPPSPNNFSSIAIRRFKFRKGGDTDAT